MQEMLLLKIPLPHNYSMEIPSLHSCLHAASPHPSDSSLVSEDTQQHIHTYILRNTAWRSLTHLLASAHLLIHSFTHSLTHKWIFHQPTHHHYKSAPRAPLHPAFRSRTLPKAIIFSPLSAKASRSQPHFSLSLTSFSAVRRQP